MSYFFMRMIPPTITHQEKKVTIKNGRPVFYEPPALQDAREKLTAYLADHRPDKPMEGPLELLVIWSWYNPDKVPDNRCFAYRTEKPDTDNLQKLLKDCMTSLKFWKDDAQVVHEIVIKCWTSEPELSGIFVCCNETGDIRELKPMWFLYEAYGREPE